ncbi:class I adenylate-forming enzyme family protein [Szabonella alba]|uniref:Acyl--CoA ligase n=1 Tax=Szabonella alba TaxID=2804194 RepID=A0A8K0XZL1_9RHOB|nr:class I adenylate-forming enzyme family protein [Szabonella alba]MBL4917235.1 acyl--CoA ligase [Szabonella alba]
MTASIITTLPPALPETGFNLAAHVLAAGMAAPDRIALQLLSLSGAERWSYGRLVAAVRGVATGLLAEGLTPGDRILLRLDNSPDFPVTFLAAITAGLIPVPTSAQLTAPEVEKLCATVTPRLIVQAEGVAIPDAPPCPVLPAARLAAMADLPPAEFALGDSGRLAYIVFTSGTSGRPQAVAHAHRAILARALMTDGWYGLTGADRLMHAGAFNWTYTLGTGLMDPWTAGATALIPAPGVTPAQLPILLKRFDATIFAAAPGVYRQMLRADLPALPRLRHGLSAGESLPPALRTEWRTRTGTDIHEALGMSEISTFISGSPGRPAPEGLAGHVQPGRTVAVLDDKGTPVPRGTSGILAIHRSDPGLFLGYFNDPEASAARFTGDWFVTGDTVQMEADGAIRYLGRGDDMMNAGGFRVSPLEVESAMIGFPGLTNCAAVELDLRPGTSVIACAYAAAAPLDDSALTAHAETRLARYKQPRIWAHMPDFPQGANGKINRRLIRQILATSRANLD